MTEAPTGPGASLASRSAGRESLLAVSRFPVLRVRLALFALDRPHAPRRGNRGTRSSLSVGSMDGLLQRLTRDASRPCWRGPESHPQQQSQRQTARVTTKPLRGQARRGRPLPGPTNATTRYLPSPSGSRVIHFGGRH